MRRVAVTVVVLLGLLAAPAGAKEPPTPGGCAAFGANVASLATMLGRDFGATASSVATSGPGAFPNAVVFPEQADLCGDG